MKNDPSRGLKAACAVSARETYASSRLLVAALCCAIGLGAVHLHFSLVPSDPSEAHRPIYLAAGAAGLWAGWAIVARAFGRGLKAQVFGALTAAFAAGLVLSVMGGVGSVLATYRYGAFATPDALFQHLLNKAVASGLEIVDSPALLPAVLVALAAALLGDLAHRMWDQPRIEPIH